jgi:hypothetical protein
MTRLRSLLEWLLILIPFLVIGFVVFTLVTGSGSSSPSGSGLPDTNGGFYQTPLTGPQEYSTSTGDWKFAFIPRYDYILAGKLVGRHEYPATLPDGIIPLDLAVVNGELIKPDILPYFTFTMGYHTLEYSYDIPAWTGLTEEYIDEHISNNHLVFLNSTLESQVKKVQAGSCVIIKGKLVDIRGTSPGSRYLIDTSTVRNDSYPAGCEIILVSSYSPVTC